MLTKKKKRKRSFNLNEITFGPPFLKKKEKGLLI